MLFSYLSFVQPNRNSKTISTSSIVFFVILDSGPHKNQLHLCLGTVVVTLLAILFVSASLA